MRMGPELSRITPLGRGCPECPAVQDAFTVVSKSVKIVGHHSPGRPFFPSSPFRFSSVIVLLYCIGNPLRVPRVPPFLRASIVHSCSNPQDWHTKRSDRQRQASCGVHPTHSLTRGSFCLLAKGFRGTLRCHLLLLYKSPRPLRDEGLRLILLTRCLAFLAFCLAV